MSNDTAQTKRFRVAILEWNSYSACIEADSPEEAEAKAREMWQSGEMDEFKLRDNGLDDVEAEELAS